MFWCWCKIHLFKSLLHSFSSLVLPYTFKKDPSPSHTVRCTNTGIGSVPPQPRYRDCIETKKAGSVHSSWQIFPGIRKQQPTHIQLFSLRLKWNNRLVLCIYEPPLTLLLWQVLREQNGRRKGTCCHRSFHAAPDTVFSNCSWWHQHHPDAKPWGAPGGQECLHEPRRVGAAPHTVQLQDLQCRQWRLLRWDEVPCKYLKKWFENVCGYYMWSIHVGFVRGLVFFGGLTSRHTRLLTFIMIFFLLFFNYSLTMFQVIYPKNQV